jgi:hypothetical protein
MTLSITRDSIITLRMATLNIMRLGKTLRTIVLSIIRLSMATLRMTKLNIMTLSIATLNIMRLGWTKTQNNITQHMHNDP